MSYLWSDLIQGVKALDYDRRRRVRDEHKDLYLDYLGLKPDSVIVDVGCGPGFFTRKVYQWLQGRAKITGIDMDSRFIQYASEMAQKDKLPNIEYIQGDALALPFRDNSVDACYSAEVIQFLDPKTFLREQKRVCKPGGSISVMGLIPGAKYYSHKTTSQQKARGNSNFGI